jgi:curli biogenesis system outer membrane secretion channel CsgG
MAGCASPPAPVSSGPPALAVWPIEDLSLQASGRPEAAELMTAAVMEAVEAEGDYALVERERLLAVLQELSLGSSELAAESTGLRIGRIVGARLMLFGAYQAVASQMRVDLRLVEVETGKVVRTAQKTAPTGDWPHMMQVAAEAARELLQHQ